MIKNIFLIIVVTINITLVLRGIAEKKYFEKEKNSLIIKVKKNNSQFLQEMDFLAQEISINCDSVFKRDPRTSKLLIYTYSGEERNNCIFQDIDLLKKKLNKNNGNDICVLPVLENTRIINIGLKTDLAGINYKRINYDLIKFPYQDGIRRRFFAILTPNGKILLPFFPDVSSPERTSVYLDFVFSKYFSND